MSISKMGILIDAAEENFIYYRVYVADNYNDRSYPLGNFFGNSAYCLASERDGESLNGVVKVLSEDEKLKVSTQFFIVYNVSCPKKEEHIKKLVTEINKTENKDSSISLISIGHEDSPLSEDIMRHISSTKELTDSGLPRDRHELLKGIIGNTPNKLPKGVVPQGVEPKKVIAPKKETAPQLISLPLNLEEKQKAFADQLTIISVKAKKLRDDGHTTAADAADTLHEHLTKYSKTYFSNPTKEAYATFKTLAKNEIKTAHEELDKHRGWKRVLGNLGLAVLGFGVLYVVAIAINKGLFFNKTDSSRKLDNLERSIESNVYHQVK